MVEWNLNNILDGRTEEELEKEVKEKVELFKSKRSELESVTPHQLKEIIMLKERIQVLVVCLVDFYELKFTENTKDQNALAKMTYYQQLGTDIGNDMVFFNLWFMHFDRAEEMINAPELQEYKFFLEKLLVLKPHMKSEEVEQIISLKSITGGAFSDIYDVLTNGFTFAFEGKELTQEEVKTYVFDKDPKKREAAYEAVFEPFKKNSVLLSEIYKNIVLEWYNEGIKIRKYASPIAIRNLRNNIDDEAVKTMLGVIRKNNDIFIEYFKLKRKINIQKGAQYPLSRYHLYAPYEQDAQKKYDYESSKEIVLETYKQFDERFYKAAKQIFDDGHVHSHPKPNKRSGAFCAHVHTSLSPYILLNHTDSMRDVFTMMHEFGHGIHDIFASKQPNLLSHPAIPMAECASIFGEMILADKLLKESNDAQEKIAILMRLLEDQWASINRQAYFVIFEQIAHEKIKDGATKDDLDKEYYNLLKEQFGDMEIPDIFKHEWNYIPHTHHTPFYCYGYAWAKLIVLSLYDMYRKEGKPFIEKYIELLATGGSKKPKDMLAPLGIDPSDEKFWQRGFDIIKEEIEELKGLV